MFSRIHVAIDAVGMRRFSGGPVVLIDLLNALTTREDVSQITVFVSPPNARDFSLPAHSKIFEVQCAQADGSRLLLLGWVTHGLGRACAFHGVHGLISLNALGWARVPTVILFQQQLMFAPAAVRLMPPGFRLRLALLRKLARSACERARFVIAQAPHVAECLTQQFKLHPSKVRVFPPDIRWPAESSGTESVDLPAGTLVYVGTDDPYKSLRTVVGAFELLRQSIPGLELALTLQEGTTANRNPGVRYLGALPRQGIRALLSRASALVMPSLAETVGLPLLEAMDVGCPIVAVDLPYARDVCGDAALYFTPADAASCAVQCRRLMESEGLRAQLIQRGVARIRELRSADPYPKLAELIVQSFAGSPA